MSPARASSRDTEAPDGQLQATHAGIEPFALSRDDEGRGREARRRELLEGSASFLGRIVRHVEGRDEIDPDLTSAAAVGQTQVPKARSRRRVRTRDEASASRLGAEIERRGPPAQGSVGEPELEVLGVGRVPELRHEVISKVELDLAAVLLGERDEGSRLGLQRSIEFALEPGGDGRAEREPGGEEQDGGATDQVDEQPCAE
jgi:hypothetical protein